MVASEDLNTAALPGKSSSNAVEDNRVKEFALDTSTPASWRENVLHQLDGDKKAVFSSSDFDEMQDITSISVLESTLQSWNLEERTKSLAKTAAVLQPLDAERIAAILNNLTEVEPRARMFVALCGQDLQKAIAVVMASKESLNFQNIGLNGHLLLRGFPDNVCHYFEEVIADGDEEYADQIRSWRLEQPAARQHNKIGQPALEVLDGLDADKILDVLQHVTDIRTAKHLFAALGQHDLELAQEVILADCRRNAGNAGVQGKWGSLLVRELAPEEQQLVSQGLREEAPTYYQAMQAWASPVAKTLANETKYQSRPARLRL